jgi:16S rRNA (cytosine967-C5)-methyltransferase
LQRELLGHASTWVKPGGTMVYATCTLHPAENEDQIQAFLAKNQDWQIMPPDLEFTLPVAEQGWIKIWPHQQNMDGFFMVKLKRNDDSRMV